MIAGAGNPQPVARDGILASTLAYDDAVDGRRQGAPRAAGPSRAAGASRAGFESHLDAQATRPRGGDPRGRYRT